MPVCAVRRWQGNEEGRHFFACTISALGHRTREYVTEILRVSREQTACITNHSGRNRV